MTEDWYPTSIRVGPEGTEGTWRFVQTAFKPDQRFRYAEFGVWKADTARNICELFPNAELHLFDFHSNIGAAKERLSAYPNIVFGYGNTQKFNDSYNWDLAKLIESQDGAPLFDYCFLDGAHTFAVDALTYFLCDKLLRVGGYMDFDDYDWRLRGSSLDPTHIPAIGDQYTDEQVDTFQVKMIVDTLVRRDVRYREVVENKIFQKISA